MYAMTEEHKVLQRKVAKRVMKKLWNSREFRQEHSNRTSNRNKRMWKDPVYRTKMEKVLRKAAEDPKRNLKASKRMIRVNKSLEYYNPESRSRSMKRRWRDERYREQMGLMFSEKLRSPSKPHKTLLARLRRAGVCGLKAEFPVSAYRIDIAHLPTKTAIESDGTRFHSDRMVVAKDKLRDKFLESRGWVVIRIVLDSRRQARHFDISRILDLLGRRKNPKAAGDFADVVLKRRRGG